MSDDSKGKRESKPRPQSAQKPGKEPKHGPDPDDSGADKVYDIPEGDAGKDLAEALRELEEHAKASHKKGTKHGKKKHAAQSRASKEESVSLRDKHEETIKKLKNNISELSEEVKSLKDKWMRSVAEFENYRKRSRKEWELLKQRSKAEVILEILSIVDDFERAFSVVGDKEDEFIQGIRMIYQNLLQSLMKFGVKPIEALNTRFDPNFHMAVAQIDSDKAESGHVVEVTEKGYLLEDTVLRPAKVIIAK